MGEKEDNKEELSVDEEDKKQFLEELKNKNLEEEKKLKELKNKELEEQKKLEEEKAKLEEEKNKQVEHINEEIPNKIEPSTNKSNKKTGALIRNFKISLIDTVTSTVVSIAALYLFDLLLRLIFGLYVADMKGVFIIIFIIILILYPVIMRSSKLKKTLGEKFTKTTPMERKD